MLDNIIGVEDAALILNLSPGTIKNKCAAGELPAKKIGKTWILDKKLLEVLKMKKFEGLNETNSTVLMIEGVEVKTTQDPYVSDCGNFYKAPAINIFGGEYELKWKVNNPEATDESEACDWNNPVKVTVVG